MTGRSRNVLRHDGVRSIKATWSLKELIFHVLLYSTQYTIMLVNEKSSASSGIGKNV